MAITVKVPGSCGELVQGMIDDSPFLVTCPINMFSTATVDNDVTVKHILDDKARTALKIVCRQLGADENLIDIKLSSQLIKSKGMSSSSADIAAVCKAAALLCGTDMTEAAIAEIAAQIEPTDGVFCNGIVKFNHITGKILQYLGDPPPLKIAVFDCGGSVDTVVFNQRGELPYLNKQKEYKIKEALKLVEYGIRYKDAAAIGRGITISALANQSILYKEDLESVLNMAERHNAVGINIAHSGTVIGVMFPADASKRDIDDLVSDLQTVCPYTKYLFTTELISGGFY